MATSTRIDGVPYTMLLGRPGKARIYRTDRGKWERIPADSYTALKVAEKLISLRTPAAEVEVHRSTEDRGNLLQRARWLLRRWRRRLFRSLTSATSRFTRAKRRS